MDLSDKIESRQSADIALPVPAVAGPSRRSRRLFRFSKANKTDSHDGTPPHRLGTVVHADHDAEQGFIEIKSDLQPSTTSGFVVGRMAEEEFTRFLDASPSKVQDSIVRHITWWKPRPGKPHSEFVILTVATGNHPSESSAAFEMLYDIRLERASKSVGITKSIIYTRVTISQSQPLGNFAEDSELIIGLCGAAARRIDSNDVAANPFSTPPFFNTAALIDILDEKWAGAPATLWHVGKYLKLINELMPQYDRVGEDLDFLPRLLMDIIGTRHWIFENIVGSNLDDIIARSSVHDPSGIGMFLRAVRKPPVDQGLGPMKIVFLVYVCLASFGTYEIVKKHNQVALWVALLWLFGLVAACFFGVVASEWWLDYRYRPVRLREHGLTARLVAAADEDRELTPSARSARGAFHLNNFMVEERRRVWVNNRDGGGWRTIKTMVEKKTPRDPIPPWRYPEQRYEYIRDHDHAAALRAPLAIMTPPEAATPGSAARATPP